MAKVTISKIGIKIHVLPGHEDLNPARHIPFLEKLMEPLQMNALLSTPPLVK